MVQQGVKAFHSTTIIAVLRDGRGAMAGDGQVTWGESTVMKHAARKVRTLAGGKVLAGFAGSAADGITLYEKFEEQLASFGNQLQRAAVELAKQWRSDKVLRRLDALMVVMDNRSVLVISGNGDVIEPDDGIAAIGSGGAYALAAARALAAHTDQQPDEIVTNAMAVAADICVYTNGHLTLERLA